MTNIYERFVEYILDSNKKISRRVSLVILIILGIILTDNILGFSTYYINNNKIEQISKINNILRDSISDEETIVAAKELRSDIIKRENIFVKIKDMAANIGFHNIKKGSTKPSLNNNKIPVDEPNKFVFYLSCGGVFFAISFFVSPILFFVDKSSSFIQRLVMTILTLMSFFCLGLFFSWLFGFIPKLFAYTWTWNYLLNSLLQIGIIFLVFKTNKLLNN